MGDLTDLKIVENEYLPEGFVQFNDGHGVSILDVKSGNVVRIPHGSFQVSYKLSPICEQKEDSTVLYLLCTMRFYE